MGKYLQHISQNIKFLNIQKTNKSVRERFKDVHYGRKLDKEFK